LPLVKTEFPGVYRRGSGFVVVYRSAGRQRKETYPTLEEAVAVKLARDAEVRFVRRGPTLHGYALGWVERYSGSGRDSVRLHTRREYRRLLVSFALRYFDREVRVSDVDRVAVQQFVDWLIGQRGRKGRLTDRSVSNALTPLRAVLEAAVADGLLENNPAETAVLPRRRGGRAYEFHERRVLTREELARLLDEVPAKWRSLFELLAATGLRISEAIALRWSDVHLDPPAPRLQVSRAIVRGVVGAPKSRHGARLVPLPAELAATLRVMRPTGAAADALVFPGQRGAPADVGSLRRRVLVPAAQRAGLSEVGFHTLRHTCASLLIERGLSVLRLQRWMGHHSPAFTLETYGHLIDGDLGPALDLRKELATRPRRDERTANRHDRRE
jgi:integrase